jgi:hypothetical protein
MKFLTRHFFIFFLSYQFARLFADFFEFAPGGFSRGFVMLGIFIVSAELVNTLLDWSFSREVTVVKLDELSPEDYSTLIKKVMLKGKDE